MASRSKPDSTMDTMSNIAYLYHHLFLPPQLPGGNDQTSDQDTSLITLVLDSLRLFLGQVDPECHEAIQGAVLMLENMQTSRGSDGYLQEAGVRQVLRSFSSDTSAFACFHMVAQNAGVLVRKDGDSVVVEVFELSPTNHAVFATRGRLVRQFPAIAIAIPSDVFKQDAFLSTLVKTLVKMSYQVVAETKPKAKKAEEYHDEDRDTTDPLIVTELLTSILRGIGDQIDYGGVRKNTREEVSWKESKLPWRRSAIWLLLRVSLHLVMDFTSIYKSFMVFLLARVLDLARDQPTTPSDVLQTMAIKISRRLLKATDLSTGTWLTRVHNIMSATSRLLDHRWQQIREHTEKQLDLTNLSSLKMADDVYFSLPDVEKFISTIQRRRKVDSSRGYSPISNVKSFDAANFPSVPAGNNEDVFFRLAMVESWVATHLDDWIQNNLQSDSSYRKLCSLVKEYHGAAQSWYARRPEGGSRMLLVILELWIAADKVAIQALPLLRDYQTEIPVQVYQALLLQSRGDMRRLHRAEQYLMDRRKNAEPKQLPSIFRSFGDKDSFPVKYFSQSPAHSQLMDEINTWADSQKQAKVEEFQRLRQSYDLYMTRHNNSVCEYIERVDEIGVPYREHSTTCQHCSWRSQASSLSMQVYEWPLSTNVFEAQATVFELNLPIKFGLWRDTTLYVFDVVLQSKQLSSNSPATSYPLRTYDGLSRFYKSDRTLRVHLLSGSNPHLATHRRDIAIGQSSALDVCVNNGLRFRYFDALRHAFVSGFTPSTYSTEICTFKLPGRSKALERFLVRDHTMPAGETPNQVMASQADCPSHFSIGEYRALVTMPFGYRIQWLSVLAQLAMPEVDFNKTETVIFLLQLSLQAGPNSSANIERCTHTRLSDIEFGRAMLDRLQDSILRIKENWESHYALWTFTFLTARLLSLGGNGLRELCLNLLKQCREICYQWLNRLRTKANKMTNTTQRNEILRIVFRVSLICADSFNVDAAFMGQIISQPEQSAILVETSINIHNNAQLRDVAEGSLESLLYDRWMHLMHRARPILVDEVVANGNFCLDMAVRRCWSAFGPEAAWSLSPSTCHWLETTSALMKVHFNLLSGELLVNGQPFSRLPRTIQNHHDFQKIFGCLVLDVVPSSRPRMRFCSIQSFLGHTAHFGKDKNGYLLLRLEQGESVLDLIPSRLFTGLLPQSFVDDYVHLYCHNTKTIELRPRKNPWRMCLNNWRLKKNDKNWELTRGTGISLVAPFSNSAQLISAILSPLEVPLRIHMLLDADNNSLEVKISSLGLDFFLNCGESALRSKQFRGMEIDDNQSLGTMIGFSSRLVIRESCNPENRTIIIPQGKVQYDKSTQGHVTATVTYGTARRVQKYKIDNELRRLVDNSTLQSKLYLAHIHAITSYCLPDPFLGKTGTEEALAILQSASVRSVDHLSQGERDILQNIAALTPDRAFYPSHERLMQTVKWSPKLSFLAQDGRFYMIVKDMVERACELQFLHPSYVTEPIQYDEAKTNLVKRDILRSSRQHVSDCGAEDFTTDHDVVYASRDRRQNSPRATMASEIAFRSRNWVPNLLSPPLTDLSDHLYNLLANEFQNPANPEAPTAKEMEYDSGWLDQFQTLLSMNWCRLHFAFQQDFAWLNSFQRMVWLTTISFAAKNDQQVAQILLIMALSPCVSKASLPQPLSYRLSQGYKADEDRILELVASSAKRFDECPEARLQPLRGESRKQTQERRERGHVREREATIGRFSLQLMRQWPCESPSLPNDSSHEIYLNGSRAMELIRPQWIVWYRNLAFKNYLEQIILRLNNIPIEPVTIRSVAQPVQFEQTDSLRGFLSSEDLFSCMAPSIPTDLPLTLNSLVRTTTADDKTSYKLGRMLDFLDLQARFEYEHRYMKELRDSLQDLRDRGFIHLKHELISEQATLFSDHLSQCKARAEEIYDALLRAIRPSSDSSSAAPYGAKDKIHAIAAEARYWPRISPTFFLRQLGRSQWSQLSQSWKESIIAYSIAITDLQQAQRLVLFQNDKVDLSRELENTGPRTWDPFKYPEWLLLECESSIRVREVQQQIAEQMISPPSEENSIMQLNMGEGKSSVIIPIVATALSTGSQLVRIVVAKPQAKQMQQILVSKLSGLIDRPIFQMPFSRSVHMNTDRVSVLRKMVNKCIKEGGIMIVQPEHLLSFQLMALESQITGDPTAGKMLDTQRFFDMSSRDIVDESDENFNVKFELIYTIGMQRPIEHTPDRWIVVQEILRRFADCALEAKTVFPQSLDIDERQNGKFPRIRILRADAGMAILNRVANSVCDTGLSGFPLARQPLQTRQAVLRYITTKVLSTEEIEAVEKSRFWDESTIHTIYLLRGLISGGILAFAFGQKRWRVDYGTDPKREVKTRLAVPYRAKDSPSPRSEFSHPDVVIVLTCLSYYYSGLEDDDLFAALDLLIRSDNADLEYKAWVDTAPNLPSPYRQLTGINLRDRFQCTSEIFPHVRFSKGAIDHFLSHMVFAKESKEFPHKLAASGWDLGKNKTNLTTGFSGTNDSRYVLPLGMKQLDLTEQKHTNALVLEILLRPENGIMLMPQQLRGATLESDSLLHMISQMEADIRVILDVGAQIIDVDNSKFSRAWLKHHEDDDGIQAVVFFNDADELTVLDRCEKVEALQTSPFAAQLDRCLVFLDEAHTRGTDLRLPTDYRAAVTLGANLTKDKLVQACMRMRKLGKGQSVVFCVPREIEQKIRSQQGTDQQAKRELEVSDVLCWAISETCQDLQRTVPIWLTQGVRFYKHKDIWDGLLDLSDQSEHRRSWAAKFLEDEGQSLQLRYHPRAADSYYQFLLAEAGTVMGPHFKRRCREFGLTQFDETALQEEQERELSPEVERERQIELPPRLQPAEHFIHDDVRHFIEHREFPMNSGGFQPAFWALSDTSAAKHLDVRQIPHHVWTTHDFDITVKACTSTGKENFSDILQRPVSWILTSTSKAGAVDRLVIISPFEAHELLRSIEASSRVTLHIYAPRHHVGFQPLDELTLYTVPRWTQSAALQRDMIVQLNLFAGQVYLSSFQEYIDVCDRLGLAWSLADDTVCLGPDGFIPPEVTEGQIINRSGFQTSPVNFCKVLISKIRRNCEDIDKTHMGKILDGVLLLESDFE